MSTIGAKVQWTPTADASSAAIRADRRMAAVSQLAASARGRRCVVDEAETTEDAVDMVTALRVALPRSVRRTLDMPLEADASALRVLLVDHTPLPRVQLLAALGMTAVSPPVAVMNLAALGVDFRLGCRLP